MGRESKRAMGQDEVPLRRTARRRGCSFGLGQAEPARGTTHVVKPDVDIHLVHEPAETLVRLLGLAPPLLVRVEGDDGLAHVDDSAKKVAQPVKVLDDQLELGVACARRPVQTSENEFDATDDVRGQLGQRGRARQ